MKLEAIVFGGDDKLQINLCGNLGSIPKLEIFSVNDIAMVIYKFLSISVASLSK